MIFKQYSHNKYNIALIVMDQYRFSVKLLRNTMYREKHNRNTCK